MDRDVIERAVRNMEKLPEAEQMFVAGIAEGMRISMETTPEEPADRTAYEGAWRSRSTEPLKKSRPL